MLIQLLLCYITCEKMAPLPNLKMIICVRNGERGSKKNTTQAVDTQQFLQNQQPNLQ